MEDKQNFKVIDIDSIEEPEIIMRSTIENDDLKELAESIKRIGLLQPIVITNIDGINRIVAGHRRFLACKMIGLKTIVCNIVQHDDAKNELMKYTENFIRLQPSAVDEAYYFNRLKSKFSLSQKEISGIINKSESYVSERLNIISYDDYTLEALKNEKITFSVARELIKIKNEDKRRELVFYAKSNGCTPEQARAWRKAEETAGIVIQKDYPEDQTEITIQGEPLREIFNTCDSCGEPKPLRKLKPMLICEDCLNPDQTAEETPNG